eukprot:6500628-Lingulodinium_polyedra.AAC.1
MGANMHDPSPFLWKGVLLAMNRAFATHRTMTALDHSQMAERAVGAATGATSSFSAASATMVSTR